MLSGVVAAAVAELGLARAATNLTSLLWAGLLSTVLIAGFVVSLIMRQPHSNCRLVIAPRTIEIFGNPSPFVESMQLKWTNIEMKICGGMTNQGDE